VEIREEERRGKNKRGKKN